MPARIILCHLRKMARAMSSSRSRLRPSTVMECIAGSVGVSLFLNHLRNEWAVTRLPARAKSRFAPHLIRQKFHALATNVDFMFATSRSLGLNYRDVLSIVFIWEGKLTLPLSPFMLICNNHDCKAAACAHAYALRGLMAQLI